MRRWCRDEPVPQPERLVGQVSVGPRYFRPGGYVPGGSPNHGAVAGLELDGWTLVGASIGFIARRWGALVVHYVHDWNHAPSRVRPVAVCGTRPEGYGSRPDHHPRPRELVHVQRRRGFTVHLDALHHRRRYVPQRVHLLPRGVDVVHQAQRQVGYQRLQFVVGHEERRVGRVIGQRGGVRAERGAFGVATRERDEEREGHLRGDVAAPGRAGRVRLDGAAQAKVFIRGCVVGVEGGAGGGQRDDLLASLDIPRRDQPARPPGIRRADRHLIAESQRVRLRPA